MKLNRSGVTRLIIVLDKVVIKIPNFTVQWSHFLAGLLSNMQEGDTWRYAQLLPDVYEPELLCPVLWYSWGGWILVMRKVDKVLSSDDVDKYDISSHTKFHPGDDKLENYGLLNGRIVKLDYGSCDYALQRSRKN